MSNCPKPSTPVLISNKFIIFNNKPCFPKFSTICCTEETKDDSQIFKNKDGTDLEFIQILKDLNFNDVLKQIFKDHFEMKIKKKAEEKNNNVSSVSDRISKTIWRVITEVIEEYLKTHLKDTPLSTLLWNILKNNTIQEINANNNDTILSVIVTNSEGVLVENGLRTVAFILFLRYGESNIMNPYDDSDNDKDPMILKNCEAILNSIKEGIFTDQSKQLKPKCKKSITNKRIKAKKECKDKINFNSFSRRKQFRDIEIVQYFQNIIAELEYRNLFIKKSKEHLAYKKNKNIKSILFVKILRAKLIFQ